MNEKHSLPHSCARSLFFSPNKRCFDKVIRLLKQHTSIFAQIISNEKPQFRYTEQQKKTDREPHKMTYRHCLHWRCHFFLLVHGTHHLNTTRCISSVWHAKITKANDRIAFEQLQRTWEIIHFIGLKFWYTGIQATRQRNWYNEKTEKNGWPLIYIFGTSFLTCKNDIFFVSSNKISLMQQISAKDVLWWNYHLDQKYSIVFYVVPWCIFHVLFFEQCVLCTNLMICINLQFLRTLKKLSLVAFKSASVE